MALHHCPNTARSHCSGNTDFDTAVSLFDIVQVCTVAVFPIIKVSNNQYIEQEVKILSLSYFFSFNKPSSAPIINEDSEVAEERGRVTEGRYDGCPLVLKNLTKEYTSKSVTSLGRKKQRRSLIAVNQLNLGLQQTEVYIDTPLYTCMQPRPFIHVRMQTRPFVHL